MGIEYFKTLFGYYKIRTESRFRKAAAEGGCRWELARDITVTTAVVVTADQALMINGRGHSVVKTNDHHRSAILVVGPHADLFIRNVRMCSTVGGCFHVDVRAKLCVDACDLQSAGDGIVNYGKAWVCGGTTMTSTRAGAVCVRNMRTPGNEVGELTLYRCTIDGLYNDGVLTVMRQDSQIRAEFTQ